MKSGKEEFEGGLCFRKLFSNILSYTNTHHINNSSDDDDDNEDDSQSPQISVHTNTQAIKCRAEGDKDAGVIVTGMNGRTQVEKENAVRCCVCACV